MVSSRMSISVDEFYGKAKRLRKIIQACQLKPALQTAFEALTPGRQRAYLLHFSEPKQSKTRVSRIEKYEQHILEGKGLQD